MLGKRLLALLFSVAMVSGHLAACEGWLATPQARMDCCADEQECPMHHKAAGPTTSTHSVRQIDADRCCAGSEHGTSAPSSVRIPSAAAVAVLPALSGVSDDAAIVPLVEWLDPAPSPPPSHARHVLFSVFLI